MNSTDRTGEAVNSSAELPRSFFSANRFIYSFKLGPQMIFVLSVVIWVIFARDSGIVAKCIRG